MHEIHSNQSRVRKVALGAVGTLLLSGIVAGGGPPSVAAEPPQAGHEVISFPQRDFVSAAGYVQGVDAYVQVIRGGVPIAISTPVTPETTPTRPGSTASWRSTTPAAGAGPQPPARRTSSRGTRSASSRRPTTPTPPGW